MQQVPSLAARGIRPIKAVPIEFLPGQLFMFAPGLSMKMLKAVGSESDETATDTVSVGNPPLGEAQPRAGLCRQL
jgi:hypothetical protein